MAEKSPPWLNYDPNAADGGGTAAAPPAWMNYDATFGDTPPPAMVDTPKPDVGANNPMVAPGDWNVATTAAHGMSLGLDVPVVAELLARREAETYRKNGADDAFIAKMMPEWRKMALGGIMRSHENYKELSPGTDLLAETAGATVPTMLGAGLAGGAVKAGAEAVGLPAVGRFLTGAAGRTMVGAPGVTVRLASEATRNTGEGAIAGALQAPLNPTESTEDQTQKGAALGALATGPMQLAKLAGRETFGTVDRRVAQNALDSGVRIPAGQIAQQPMARAVARSFGGPPARQATDIAAVRRGVAQQYADIAAQAGVHGMAVDPVTGIVSGPRLEAALSHQLATTPWHFDSALYRRFQGVARQEAALDAIEPRLASTPGAHPLLNRLGHIGLHAGIGAGMADATLMALQHPHAWPIIAGGAGASAVARRLGNAIMNSRGVSRMQLRGAAAGLTPTEYLGLSNPAIAGGNRLMEYYGVHPEEAQNGQ